MVNKVFIPRNYDFMENHDNFIKSNDFYYYRKTIVKVNKTSVCGSSVDLNRM